MRLWGKLTWVARAAVAGSILALFGLIVYLILPFRPASFPLVTAGFVLFLAAGLCRSRSNIERIPKRSRAWMWLAWAWWTTAAGTILFAVSFAMAVMSVPRYAFLPSRVMGILLILLGGLAVSRSEICLAPPGSVKRLSLKWAWWNSLSRRHLACDRGGDSHYPRWQGRQDYPFSRPGFPLRWYFLAALT